MRLSPVVVAALLVAAPAALAAPGKLSEILVDVSEDNQPVRDVLRRLQAAHGLNYVVSDKLLEKAGTVTVELSQVPLDDALDAICVASGLFIQFRGTIVVMLPAGARAPLPRVKEGLLEKGAAATAPLPKPKGATADTFRTKPVAKPTLRPAPKGRVGSAMMVGNVTEIDLEVGRLQLTADGLKRDFYLAGVDGAEHTIQFDRLRSALAMMQKGHRVALLYERTNKRSVMTDLIGGDHVRDAELPTGKRRRTGPPRLRKPERAKVSAPKKPPLPMKTVQPNGVLTGSFVGYEGDVVKIKRADGVVIDCYLPGDDAAGRAKLEALVMTTEVGAQLFVTYEDVDGKVILRGGISEKR
jgi:hypothetical protein